MWLANEDANSLPPEDITTGKRLGFLDSLENSYKQTALYYSQFGAEQALREAEAENLYRIRKVGGQPPSALGFELIGSGLPDIGLLTAPGGGGVGQYLAGHVPYTEYLRQATSYTDEQARRGIPKGGQLMQERNDQLRELQTKYPDAGIQTYDEMLDGIKANLAHMRRLDAHDTSAPGTLGWLAGQMAGGIDPRVNPVNFMTLPVGGVGKSALTRILTQGAGQGAAEAVAQFTGTRENQRILGGNPTIGESIGQIAAQAAMGGAIQGAGEIVAKGAGFLGRKWFRHAPNDPAIPPPKVEPRTPSSAARLSGQGVIEPPTGLAAEADARITQAVRETVGLGRNADRVSRADFQAVREQLDRMGGPMPWEVPPTAHTRIYMPGEQTVRNAPTPASPGETVDEIARRIDPETFRQYDRLNEIKTEQRSKAIAAGISKTEQLIGRLGPIDTEIRATEAKLAGAGKRALKRLQPKLAELKAQREALVEAGAAQVHVQEADYRMRDLAPAVSRAYARARDRWKLQDEQRADVERMMHEGVQSFERMRTFATGKPNVANTIADEEFGRLIGPPRSPLESIPELQSSIAQPVPAGKDAIDEVKRVQTEQLKTADAGIDAFRQSVKKLLEPPAKPAAGKVVEPATIQLPGMSRALPLDGMPIRILREDGSEHELTIRQMLEEIEEDNTLLRAVSTCAGKAK